MCHCVHYDDKLWTVSTSSDAVGLKYQLVFDVSSRTLIVHVVHGRSEVDLDLCLLQNPSSIKLLLHPVGQIAVV